MPSASAEQAEVVTCGGEDEVGGIGRGAEQEIAPEMAVALQVPMTSSMALRSRRSRRMVGVISHF